MQGQLIFVDGSTIILAGYHDAWPSRVYAYATMSFAA